MCSEGGGRGCLHLRLRTTCEELIEPVRCRLRLARTRVLLDSGYFLFMPCVCVCVCVVCVCVCVCVVQYGDNKQVLITLIIQF